MLVFLTTVMIMCIILIISAAFCAKKYTYSPKNGDIVSDRDGKLYRVLSNGPTDNTILCTEVDKDLHTACINPVTEILHFRDFVIIDEK